MSDSVVVEYELTHEDWISAAASHAERSEPVRRAQRAFRLGFGIMVAALTLLLLWGDAVTAAFVAALSGTLWMVLNPLLIRRTRDHQLRRLAREGVANGIFGPHRVVLTDEGILDCADGFDWLIHWSAVERVEDDGKALLIYNGANSFLTIPLRAFPDREAFETFSRRFFRGLEGAGRLTYLAEEDGGEPHPDTESGPSSVDTETW